MLQEKTRPRTELKRVHHAFFLGWSLAGLGGVNEVVRNLVREFSESGWLDPLVVEVADAKAQKQSDSDVPTLYLPLRSPWDERHPWKAIFAFLIFLPKLLWELRRLCIRYNVQVLNPHFIGLEYFPLALFRRLGLFRGRLLLSFHGSDIRAMIQSKGLERYLSGWLLRSADVLVPCSEGLGEEILLFVPECAQKIKPVPNGIDIERTIQTAAKEFSLPANFEARRRILNIGAYEQKKGHDVLLRAFALLKQSHPDTCLIIAGQTRSLFESTRQLAADLGLNDDVLLLQDLPHEEVVSLLQSADLFALSSRWEKGKYGEGFAMALLEAAAAQKPVVSTNSCGVSELIAHRESGLIVDPEEPELLAEALAELLDHPADAARLARNLNTVVRRKFTWKAAHANYLRLVARGEPTIRKEPRNAKLSGDTGGLENTTE